MAKEFCTRKSPLENTMKILAVFTEDQPEGEIIIKHLDETESVIKCYLGVCEGVIISHGRVIQEKRKYILYEV